MVSRSKKLTRIFFFFFFFFLLHAHQYMYESGLKSSYADYDAMVDFDQIFQHKCSPPCGPHSSSQLLLSQPMNFSADELFSRPTLTLCLHGFRIDKLRMF